MNTPFVDIHTHRCGKELDVRKICVHLLGRDCQLPADAYVAGVHPWDVGKVDPRLLDFFQSPPAEMVGIGEIGLDYSGARADKALQLEWLNRQLVIAERLQLPLFLHCVKAYYEILAELKRYRLKAVIFHGFVGSIPLADTLMKQGYYLSFGGVSLHSPKTVAVIRKIPANRFFLETDDDPELQIRRIYGEVAVLRGVSMEQLKADLYHTYKAIFHE